MKKTIKGFVLGLIIATLLMSTVFGAGVKKTIEVAFNSINLTVNGQKVDAENILYKGTTYVPLRAVGEMLGKNVGWDGITNTASINDKKKVTAPVKKDGLVEDEKPIEIPKEDISYGIRNPAPIGTKQIVNVDDYNGNYGIEITVIEAIRGEKASRLIQDANYLNTIPDSDEEYVLAKIKVKLLNSENDRSVRIESYNFDIFNKDNVKYKTSSRNIATTPEPEFGTTLYSGGVHEGYVGYLVKKSDSGTKLVYGQNYDGTGGIWFNLND